MCTACGIKLLLLSSCYIFYRVFYFMEKDTQQLTQNPCKLSYLVWATCVVWLTEDYTCRYS